MSPRWNTAGMRRLGVAAALAAAGAAALVFAAGTPPALAPAPSPAARAASGPARPAPSVEGWRPVGVLPGADASGAGVFRSDEPPDAALRRAEASFRAAGWSPEPPVPGADPRRRTAVYRSGAAAAAVGAEPDPRTGGSRCVIYRF